MLLLRLRAWVHVLGAGSVAGWRCYVVPAPYPEGDPAGLSPGRGGLRFTTCFTWALAREGPSLRAAA